MKVAIINPSLIGHHHRGTGVYTRLLLRSLKSYTDTIVIEANSNQLPTNVDLYHFPYFDPFFLTLPWFRARKTVLTIHDLIPLKFADHFPRGLRGEFKWQVQKYLARRADEIITDSNISKKDIVDVMGVDSAKVHAIYLAPDPIFSFNRTQTEKNIVIKKYSLPKSFALFVGDVNWNKNLPRCIQAAVIANIPLVVVSKTFAQSDNIANNSWNQSMREAKSLIAKESKIITLGKVDLQELSVMYQIAMTLLMPSYYEGFGLPVVEAFASGCPVIASNRGSLDEVAGDAAIFVDPENVNDIAQALLAAKTQKQFITNNIKKGKIQAQKFSWQNTAQQTYNVYRNCIES